jgi:DNA-binding MarR family transcriptional regulator
MRLVYDHYERRLSSFGLTSPQFFVFNALWMGDGISIGELGERVALDSSTLTGIIDRMERNEYVERKPNPADRRSILIFLTPKARDVGPQILKYAEELDAKLRRPFTPEDIETFEYVLKAMAEVAEWGQSLCK